MDVLDDASVSISDCLTYRAASDPQAYRELLAALRYNLGSSYSIFACRCRPPCATHTEAELEVLLARLRVDLEAEWSNAAPAPNLGPRPKLVFPVVQRVAVAPASPAELSRRHLLSAGS